MTAALYGYAIDSPFPLSRARQSPSPRGRLQLDAGTGLLDRDGELVSWSDVEGSQFAIAASGDELVAWCSSTGTYVVNGPRGRITVDRRGAAVDWEHRLGSTMVPLLLAERGDLALHAAAAVAAGRAIVLCGPSGRGKSTVAAALAAQGHAILSDDGVVVSELSSTPLAWPGPAGLAIAAKTARVVAPSIEVDRAGRGRKALGLAHRCDLGPAPVAAIVLLEERGGDVAQARRIEAAGALRALMPHLIYGGPRRVAATLALAASAVERVPVLRFRLPDRVDRVAQAAAELVRTAADSRYGK